MDLIINGEENTHGYDIAPVCFTYCIDVKIQNMTWLADENC